MDRSNLHNGLSAEELAQRLGELLTQDEMDNIVGGSMEFAQVSGLQLD